MRRPLAATCAAGLLLVSLTACATGTPMADPTPSASERPPFAESTRGPVTTPPTSGTPVEVPEARWDAIVADLAARDAAGEPTIVSAESVTWQDGSLGCPEPGTSYTQALVEGMRVVVEAGGATYDYRFGRSDSPVLCEG